MVRIYVKKQGEISGHVFKSRFSILKDKVLILPWTFVMAGVITSAEWANSQETIKERFGLYIEERQIDGRTKIGKSMPYFSWHNVLCSRRSSEKSFRR